MNETHVAHGELARVRGDRSGECTERQAAAPSAESPVAAGTILGMPKDRAAMSNDGKQRPALPKDQSRLEMMAREKRMTLEQRVELFERLSRDAAWARSAKRVR